MDIWDMRREIGKAKQTITNADNIADSIARILPGRLRHVSSSTLRELKMELKDFNAHTFKWKEN